jgi:hypothetical protein
MKLALAFFSLLVALWLVLGATLLTAPVGLDHGFKHPEFKEMDRGGPVGERRAKLLTQAWLFGSLQLAVFVACLLMGARRRGWTKGIQLALLAGLLPYAAAFTLIIAAYGRFVDDVPVPFAGPFPVPTALVLFGMTSIPLYFVLLYVVMFDRWIFSRSDLQQFRDVVAADRKRRAEGN